MSGTPRRRPARPARLAALAAVTLALGACGEGESAGGSGGSGEDVELDGRTFVSTAVDGHQLVADSTIRLFFDGESMVASAGCNTMTATYTLDGDRLAWSEPPAQTRMACEPELMTQDEWLAGLLIEGVDTSASEDADLVLESGDVRIELAEDSA